MPLPATDGPVSAGYDVVLLDLDGVVYLGPEPVPNAAAAVEALRRRGVRVGFVTNNASRSPADVAARLAAVGVPSTPADVVTSAQAAAALLGAQLPPQARVLVLGAPSLADEVAAVGLVPVRRADEDPQAVVNGFFDGICYNDLSEAALALRAGAVWVATNLDATVPTPRGLQPGNGSLTALLATATGRSPTSAGKPQPPLLAEAVRRTGARRALFVGDRVDTDVAGAAAAGMDSMLVLTGVADPAAVLAATAEQRPTYLARDLRGLLEPQPATTGDEREASCGGWRATRTEDAIALHGAGDALDGLRAAAALAWAVRESTGAVLSTVRGLPALDEAPAGRVTSAREA